MTARFLENYTRNELMQRVGHIAQLGGVELSELQEGKARGVRVLNFRTGNLTFTSVVERAMDISRMEFCGQPLAWISPVGIPAPWSFEPQGLGPLRSFFGGLLTTCGMTHILLPAQDTAEQYFYPAKPTEDFPLHGRATGVPAELVSHGGKWVGEDYLIWAEGKITEACLFGENLCLTRRIETHLGSKSIKIRDEVENIGWFRTPHMYLYHVNAGFPVVDEGAEIILPTRSTVPANEPAAAGLKTWNICHKPTRHKLEEIFLQEMEPDPEGWVQAGIANKRLNNGDGLGFFIRYPKKAMPFFWIWKIMGQGVYSVGLEPATNSIEGRLKDREAGRLAFLDPGEKRLYELEIGVLSGKSEIEEFERRAKRPA
jgi:hypothetical protein